MSSGDLRRIGTGAALLGLAVLLTLSYTVREILLVMLIGIGIGVLLAPLVEKFQRKLHIPRGVTAFLLIIGMAAVVGGVGYAIYYIFYSQLDPVMNSLPAAYDSVRAWLSHHTGMSGGGRTLNLPSTAENLMTAVFKGAKLGFELIAGLFYIVSVSLYVAVDPKRNQNAFLTLFPARRRERVRALMGEAASTLRQWFLSHLIVVVCIGAAYGLGLWILGNPYWELFAFLAAVLEFVPYIGPFLIGLGASAVALTSGHPMTVLWVIVLDLVIQELEGHVILPIVMKDRIDIPPVQLITMAIVMGIWFGIIGVFATPPLLAVIRVVYLETYVRRMNEIRPIHAKKAA